MVNTKTKAKKREHLAVKWHYLDNLEPGEIQERFRQEGMKVVTIDTIKKYLRGSEAEEVLDAIQKKHDHTVLQIAEKMDAKHDRARKAEAEATKAEPVKGVVPATAQADGRKNQVRIPYSWERIEPDDEDYPDWAEPGRDKPIRILEDQEELVEGGESYPVTDVFGDPKYTSQTVAIKRDLPAHKSRSFLRQEQREHLETKADILGVTEERIEIGGSLSIDTDVSVPDEVVEAISQASRDRLKSDEEEAQ